MKGLQEMKPKLRKQYVVTKHKKDIIEIAVEVYGNGGMAGKILQENPGVYQLKAGMVLNLPPDEPQKPATADQVMRLDYAGLRDFQMDTGSKFKPEEAGEIIPPKEQVAWELLRLIRDGGLVRQAEDAKQEENQSTDHPEENQESDLNDIASEKLEAQQVEQREGDGGLENLVDEVENLADPNLL
jgi:hypothetical protein